MKGLLGVYRMAWLCLVLFCPAPCHSLALRYMARHGKTPLRIACRVMASHRVTRHGFVLHGMQWLCVALLCPARHAMASRCVAWQDVAQRGTTWHDMARHGLVLNGMAFPGFPLFPDRFALLPAVPLVSGMHFRG